MKRKKILILGLIISMVLSNISFAHAEKDNRILSNTNDKIEIKEKSEIKIKKEVAKYQYGNIKIDIEIPVIEGLTDLKFQEQINDTIKQKALKLKTDFEKEAKKVSKEYKKLGKSSVEMEFNLSFDVKNENGVISIVLKTYTYIGAGNGQNANYYFNIDIDQNMMIKLSDLFKTGSNYKEIINKEIQKQILEMENKDRIFWKDKEFKFIANDNSFYIEDGNLVIVFPQYSIISRDISIPEFRIPLYKLNDCLRNPVSTIERNVYYNNKYNFQFKMPSSWEEKVYIVEHHALNNLELKVNFIYTPENSNLEDCELMSILAIDRDAYYKLSKSGKERLGYKVSETKEYVFLIEIYNGRNPYVFGSRAYNEYKELEISIDKIDELFKLTLKEESKKDIKDYKWVIVNGKKVKLDKDVYINKNGTLMIPVAIVSRTLGYTVKWNSKTKTITLDLDGDKTSTVTIGKNQYAYSKSSFYLAESSIVIDGITFVPIDYFEKVLKLNVSVNVDGVLTIENK